MSTKQKTLYAYLILTITYAAGTLLIPPPKRTLQRYHTTLQHLRLLDLTFILLFAAIWLSAVYAFYNFRQYYHVIKKTKEGKPLAYITTGIGLLAFWFPVIEVFDTYTNYAVQKHVSFTGPVIVMQNYLALLIPLIGFVFLSIGARKLTEIVKQRPTMFGTNGLVIVLIVIGVTYVYLLTGTHNRVSNAYHLSTINILVTLAIPYIYMWFIGLLSAYEIFLYRVKAPGIIYRQSWQQLALGTSSLIVLSITIQYLSTVSEQLDRLSLVRALMVIYALLVLLAIAYVLVALGARNLKKIEEV